MLHDSCKVAEKAACTQAEVVFWLWFGFEGFQETFWCPHKFPFFRAFSFCAANLYMYDDVWFLLLFWYAKVKSFLHVTPSLILIFQFIQFILSIYNIYVTSVCEDGRHEYFSLYVLTTRN